MHTPLNNFLTKSYTTAIIKYTSFEKEGGSLKLLPCISSIVGVSLDMCSVLKCAATIVCSVSWNKSSPTALKLTKHSESIHICEHLEYKITHQLQNHIIVQFLPIKALLTNYVKSVEKLSYQHFNVSLFSNPGGKFLILLKVWDRFVQ